MIYLYQEIQRVLQIYAKANQGGDRQSMTIAPEQRLKCLARIHLDLDEQNGCEILVNPEADIQIEISYHFPGDGWIVYHALFDIDGHDLKATIRISRCSAQGFYEDIPRKLEKHLKPILTTQYSDNFFDDERIYPPA